MTKNLLQSSPPPSHTVSNQNFSPVITAPLTYGFNCPMAMWAWFSLHKGADYLQSEKEKRTPKGQSVPVPRLEEMQVRVLTFSFSFGFSLIHLIVSH